MGDLMETRVIISFSKLSMSIFITFIVGVMFGIILGIYIGNKLKKW
jgi:F0F1-type ATP synthase assembly protein I